MAVGSLAKGLAPYAHLLLFALIVDAVSATEPRTALGTIYAILATDLVLGLIGHGCDEHIKTVTDTSYGMTNGRLAEKAMSVPFSVMDDPRTLDAMAKVDAGSNGNGGINEQVKALYDLLTMAVGVAGAAIMMAVLLAQALAGGGSWLSVAILIAVYAVVLYAGYKVSSVMNQRSERMRKDNEHNNTVSSYLYAYAAQMGNACDLRITSLKRLWDHLVEKYDFGPLAIYLEWGRMDGRATGLTSLLTGLASGLAYVLIGQQALAGAISVGSVLLYAGAVASMAESAMTMLSLYEQTSYCLSFLDVMVDFILQKTADGAGIPVTDGDHVFRFEDVSFRYPGQDRDILHDVSLTLQPHLRTAVVGPNGAGKSTFIKLLCRLYRPTGGRITMDGRDIWDYDERSYFALFAVVFQDFKIFDFSLGDNVAGGPGYDGNRVKLALNQAGLEKRLTEGLGLDSQLGHDNGQGVELSGGEAQKVAIARALYKTAPWVILDEPTAALDPFSEQEIYRRFAGITAHRSAIYISHRMSSCRFCDDILVFDRGTVVQHGSHDELVGRPGMYRQLWQAQAQYYQQPDGRAETADKEGYHG